ncbi:MAG: c-type cytochrome [Terriglobales bacterium]
MRKGVIIVLVLVVLAGAGAWVWLRSANGFSADAKPTWIEASLASLSRRLALPGNQRSLKNPYPATPPRLAAAQQLFHTQCALCHGDDGQGQTAIGRQLYPHPPNLGGPTENKTDGALYYSIRNGIRMSGMPAWNQDSEEEIWNLVSYIRSLRKQ